MIRRSPSLSSDALATNHSAMNACPFAADAAPHRAAIVAKVTAHRNWMSLRGGRSPTRQSPPNGLRPRLLRFARNDGGFSYSAALRFASVSPAAKSGMSARLMAAGRGGGGALAPPGPRPPHTPPPPPPPRSPPAQP